MVAVIITRRGLPQLSSCGPIEASFCGRRRRRLPRPFRNCQVAAPLKHTQGGLDAALGRTFRNCQVAAPLKLFKAYRGKKLGLAFRNCQVAAPLKRHGARPCNVCPRRLPQLSSCGPIEARRGSYAGRRRRPFRNCQVAAPLKPRGAIRGCRGSTRPSATVKLRPH